MLRVRPSVRIFIFNLDLPEGYSILINIQGQHGDLDNLSLKRVQDVYR